MRPATPRSTAAVACLLFLTAGCTAPEKHVGIGEVVEIDAGRRVLTVRHEPIAPVLDAATSQFTLAADAREKVVEPGTRVRFEIVRDGAQFAVVRLDALAEGNPGLHDHTPHHGGIVGMAGMIHLEARAEPNGLVEIYLTDRWRKPLPLDAVRGSVTLRLPDGDRELPLTAGASAMQARAARLDGRDVNARVRLVREDEPIEMHFLLPLQEEGKAAVGVPSEGCVAPAPASGAARSPHCAMTFARPVSAIAASPDGTMLLVAIADLGVSAWDVASGRLLRSFAAPPPVAVPTVEAPHVEAAHAIVFHPAAREAAVVLENRVIVYSLDSAEVIRAIDSRAGIIRDVAWSSDGERLLLTTFYHRGAQLLDARDGRALGAFLVEREGAAVAFAPDGAVAAVGSETGSITLFDLASGRSVRSFRRGRAVERAVAFAGAALLAGGDAGSLGVFDATNGSLLYESPAGEPIHHLRVAPGGRLAATAGVGGKIRLHDLERRQVVETLARRDTQVSGLAWAGARLVSADTSGEVAVWDAVAPPP